jgi:hypothetical protein
MPIDDLSYFRLRNRLANPLGSVSGLPRGQQGRLGYNESLSNPLLKTPNSSPVVPPMNVAATVRNNISNPPDTGLLSLRNRPKILQDEYQSYLRDAPSRKDYQLGKVGKALSLASGVIEGGISKSPTQGVELGMALMERPYRTALEEHEIKGRGLKEQVALERLGFEDELKIAEEERQRFAAISDALYKGSQMDWNNARIRDIDAKAKYAGWEMRENKETGQLEAVNLDGRRLPIAKFYESYAEAEARGQKLEDYLQENRMELGTQRGDQAINLEKLRQQGRLELLAKRALTDKELEGYKAQLAEKAGMNNTQQNAALEGAYQEAFQLNPGLVSILFKQDEAGNWIQKTEAEGFDPDVYKLFIEKYKQRINNRLGKSQESTNLDKFYTGQESPQVNLPTSTTPQIKIPTDYSNPNALRVPPEEPDPYAPLPDGINPQQVPSSAGPRTPQVASPEDTIIRNAATEYIRRNYKDNPEFLQNEELISEIMQAIKSRMNTDNPVMLEDPQDKQPPLAIPNKFLLPTTPQSNMQTAPQRPISNLPLLMRDYPLSMPQMPGMPQPVKNMFGRISEDFRQTPEATERKKLRRKAAIRQPERNR